MVLVAVAAGILAATAATSDRVVTIARRDAEGVALATERLECLRTGPRADGTDGVVGSDGTMYTRTWRVTPGRGRPDRLDLAIAWPGHALAIGTKAAR